MSSEKEFGEYIKALRKEKKLSLRELGKQSGISNAYISQIENGIKGVPSISVLKSMHKALGVSYSEMMEQAGYAVFFDGEEKIKKLEEELDLAKKKIKELEGDLSLVYHLVKKYENK